VSEQPTSMAAADMLTAAAAVGGTVVLLVLLRRTLKPNTPSKSNKLNPADMDHASHSLLRKQMLAKARPTDNAGSVKACINENFDLDRTIFKTLPSQLSRLHMRTHLDVEYNWDEQTSKKINSEYVVAKLPKNMSDNMPIYRFMAEECDFSIEHADGSFMDHLHFCQEYSVRYFPEVSPRALLLHSICGVGSNCFPMSKEKLPTLQSLLTNDEFRQIQAFPSVLRILFSGALLNALAGEVHRLDKLQEMKLNRVIDNVPISLTAEEFWVQLNLQLIHLLDFLPVGGWADSSSFFLHHFGALHGFLKSQGQLRAKVDFDPAWAKPRDSDLLPRTVRHTIFNSMLTKETALKMISKTVAKYSKAIGHDLEFSFDF